MKRTLFLGSSLLALATAVTLAGATVISYIGALVTFTVPSTGSYRIVAFGAQGGASGSTAGGDGAAIGGVFTLNGGDVLQIAVGGQGG